MAKKWPKQEETKQKGMNKPPITVKRINEPNLRLIAMAFSNLYHQTKNIDKRSNDEE
ncbi:hypothetical protein [Peribacillus phoenicis]|uniref:hypothetical protein n=1 Tax=unclassified Peribacillus TaxID=2675266 RepID=UPI00399F9684